jgi:hypothetical protein
MESNDNLQDLVRSFLKEHTTYDVLPVSYRLIVLDTQLLVKKALAALMQNGKLPSPNAHIRLIHMTQCNNRDSISPFMV